MNGDWDDWDKYEAEQAESEQATIEAGEDFWRYEEPQLSFAEMPDEDIAELFEATHGERDGFEAQWTFNPAWKAYSFALCEDKESAERCAIIGLNSAVGVMNKQGYSRVVPCKIKTCRCGNLMHSDMVECLKCDHLRCDL